MHRCRLVHLNWLVCKQQGGMREEDSSVERGTTFTERHLATTFPQRSKAATNWFLWSEGVLYVMYSRIKWSCERFAFNKEMEKDEFGVCTYKCKLNWRLKCRWEHMPCVFVVYKMTSKRKVNTRTIDLCLANFHKSLLLFVIVRISVLYASSNNLLAIVQSAYVSLHSRRKNLHWWLRWYS